MLKYKEPQNENEYDYDLPSEGLETRENRTSTEPWSRTLRFQIIHQTGSDCLPSLTASNRLLEERGGGLDGEKERWTEASDKLICNEGEK